MDELADILTVDSFHFLWRQMVANMEHYRNILAVVGALYVSNKALHLLYTVIQGVAIHGISRFFPVRLAESGEWAAVTGPTEGIGRAFAIELAKRGMSVVLLGRNPDKLKELSDTIRREYKQQTKTVIIDFNNPGKAYEVVDEVFGSLNIGLLVNNVGTINSYPAFLHEMDDEEIMSMVTVNIQSVTKMTKIAVTHMRKRRKGFILNVSSIASLAPAPLLQVYAATKAYVTSFSQAMRAEVKRDGIIVQTLIPSYVKTRMVGYSSYLSTSLLNPTPEVYVQNALATVKYTSYTTGYWLHGIQAYIITSLPVTLYMYMIRRANLLFRHEYLSHRD